MNLKHWNNIFFLSPLFISVELWPYKLFFSFFLKENHITCCWSIRNANLNFKIKNFPVYRHQYCLPIFCFRVLQATPRALVYGGVPSATVPAKKWFCKEKSKGELPQYLVSFSEISKQGWQATLTCDHEPTTRESLQLPTSK